MLRNQVCYVIMYYLTSMSGRNTLLLHLPHYCMQGSPEFGFPNLLLKE